MFFIKKFDQIYKWFDWHVVGFFGRKETTGFLLINFFGGDIVRQGEKIFVVVAKVKKERF
jgi:hypothetical protein